MVRESFTRRGCPPLIEYRLEWGVAEVLVVLVVREDIIRVHTRTRSQHGGEDHHNRHRSLQKAENGAAAERVVQPDDQAGGAGAIRLERVAEEGGEEPP